MKKMVSILVLTRNEEANLPNCLASVAWSDDVVVFDSCSTDGTVRIAREHGAKVVERTFDNWSAHQNWACTNIPFKYPWVFYIDADETVTSDLRVAILAAADSPGENVAFRVQRRDFLNGTWLRHVQTSPFYLRLFRPEKMRYERLVNPVSIPDGPVGQLKGYLDHNPFSKGVGDWIERHNKYASFEAAQIVANRRDATHFRFWPALRSAFTDKDFHSRRFNQKELFYRFPARPLVKFALLYGLKRGFLDGRAGLQYAILQSIYEFLIVLKTEELMRLDGESGGK